MTVPAKNNIEAAQETYDRACAEINDIVGTDVPEWLINAKSNAASAYALISISCQLDRIANALEANALEAKATIDGREIATVVKRVMSERKSR